MATKFLLPLIASLCLGASAALAQDAPPPPPAGANSSPDLQAPGKAPSKEDMEKMHARMCLDGYAMEAGRLATLEVRLQLTAKQQSAFDRWKAVKLAAAKARAADCSAMKMPDPGKAEKPSFVEGLKAEERHLKDRLADIKAELPASEALAAVLSDEQKCALAPPHHGGPHGPQGGPEASLPPPAK
jgi:hypothetical protein